MKRIQQKSVWALFCALAVSMLLGACDSPNTPTPNPGNGQQGQQGQNGGSSGGGTSSSGAVAGGGSYSSTKAPLTPEGKALPGTGPEEGQKDDSSKEKDPPPAEEKEVTVTVKTITGATADEGLYDQVAGYNKPHKIKVAKDLVNEELAAELLKELLKVLKDDATIAKDCMLYKEEAGKTPLTKKNTDELKDGGTVYFGKRNDKEAKDVKLTISSVEGTPSVGGKSFKAVTTDDLKGTAQDHHLGLLVGRTVSEDKVAAEIKALIVANIAPDANIGEGKNKFRFFNKNNPSANSDIVALDALTVAGSINNQFFVGIQTVD